MLLLAVLVLTGPGCASLENLRHPVAPPLELTTLGGEPLAPEDYAGKVVLVEFWASWCGPCHSAFPHLQAAYDQYKDHPEVAFLLVNVSWSDTREQAAHYLAQNAYTFPAAWDDGGRLAEAFGVRSIPTTFVIGRDGRIRHRKVGFNPATGSVRTYTQALERQLRRPVRGRGAQTP